LRILLSVEHPAWAHQFRYIIKELEAKGHTVKVVAINKDHDLELLDIFNIDYEVISDSSGKGFLEKGMIFLNTTWRIFLISRKFKPDLFIGRASPMMAINNFIFRKKHLLFEDTEHASFSLSLCKLFSTVIITSNSFKNNLGNKQIRVNTYKELFYLYPKYFQPNPATLAELGISEKEKFIIIRFVAWDAHHDYGQSGINNKLQLVHEIEKYGRVLITSEVPLTEELEKYKIKISIEKLHDLLYYATLYIGEGSTTASECAVLGTHAIYVNTLTTGYTEEQENRYNLVFHFSKPDEINNGMGSKVKELLNDPDLWAKGKQKRKKILEDKIDATAFMLWFIEHYPESFDLMKKNPELQEQFRIQ
jgi:uncharacterized protein